MLFLFLTPVAVGLDSAFSTSRCRFFSCMDDSRAARALMPAWSSAKPPAAASCNSARLPADSMAGRLAVSGVVCTAAPPGRTRPGCVAAASPGARLPGSAVAPCAGVPFEGSIDAGRLNSLLIFRFRSLAREYYSSITRCPSAPLLLILLFTPYSLLKDIPSGLFPSTPSCDAHQHHKVTLRAPTATAADRPPWCSVATHDDLLSTHYGRPSTCLSYIRMSVILTESSNG